MENFELPPAPFSAEQRSEELGQAAQQIITEFQSLKQEYYSSRNFEQFCQKSEEAEKNWSKAPPEIKIIADCFFGIADEARRTDERPSVWNALKGTNKALDPKISPNEKTKQLDQLNLAESAWQINCACLLRMFGEHPRGRETILTFWRGLRVIFEDRLPALSPEDNYRTSDGEKHFRKLRSGILNLVAVTYIVNRMGLEFDFPTPEQDALKKIDLWIWDRSQQPEGVTPAQVVAAQIKSAPKMKQIGSSEWMEPLDRENAQKILRDKATTRKLAAATREYASLWNIKVVPLLLYVPSLEIDRILGKPSEESNRALADAPFFGQLIKNSLEKK